MNELRDCCSLDSRTQTCMHTTGDLECTVYILYGTINVHAIDAIVNNIPFGMKGYDVYWVGSFKADRHEL